MIFNNKKTNRNVLFGLFYVYFFLSVRGDFKRKKNFFLEKKTKTIFFKKKMSTMFQPGQQSESELLYVNQGNPSIGGRHASEKEQQIVNITCDFDQTEYENQKARLLKNRSLYTGQGAMVHDIQMHQVVFSYENSESNNYNPSGNRKIHGSLSGIGPDIEHSKTLDGGPEEEAARLAVESRITPVGVSLQMHKADSLYAQLTVQQRGTHSIYVDGEVEPGDYLKISAPTSSEKLSQSYIQRKTRLGGIGEESVLPVIKKYVPSKNFRERVRNFLDDEKAFKTLYSKHTTPEIDYINAHIDHQLLCGFMFLYFMFSDENFQDILMRNSAGEALPVEKVFNRLAVGIGLAKDNSHSVGNFTLREREAFNNKKMLFLNAVNWDRTIQTAYLQTLIHNKKPDNMNFMKITGNDDIPVQIVSRQFNDSVRAIYAMEMAIKCEQGLIFAKSNSHAIAGEKCVALLMC